MEEISYSSLKSQLRSGLASSEERSQWWPVLPSIALPLTHGHNSADVAHPHPVEQIHIPNTQDHVVAAQNLLKIIQEPLLVAACAETNQSNPNGNKGGYPDDTIVDKAAAIAVALVNQRKISHSDDAQACLSVMIRLLLWQIQHPGRLL